MKQSNMHAIEPLMKRKRWVRSIFELVMAIIKKKKKSHRNSHIPEVQRNPNRFKKKKNIPRYMLVKVLKPKIKEKVPEATSEIRITKYRASGSRWQSRRTFVHLL